MRCIGYPELRIRISGSLSTGRVKSAVTRDEEEGGGDSVVMVMLLRTSAHSVFHDDEVADC